MLERCNAFIIAASKEQSNSLTKLARRVGFANVIAAREPASWAKEAAPNRINFFLMHFQMQDEMKQAVLSAVRQDADPEVHFAPVVLIIDDCPFEQVLFYVQLGFDDVISLPEKADVVTQRLSRQLLQPHLYIETSEYLGPDRRRMEAAPALQDPRRLGLTRHARYLIERVPDSGTRVLQKTLA